MPFLPPPSSPSVPRPRGGAHLYLFALSSLRESPSPPFSCLPAIWGMSIPWFWFSLPGPLCYPRALTRWRWAVTRVGIDWLWTAPCRRCLSDERRVDNVTVERKGGALP